MLKDQLLWYPFPLLNYNEYPCLNSYLKSLLPSFNECTDKLLDNLRPLADGKTVVPMKQYLADVTLDVISKVTLSHGVDCMADAYLTSSHTPCSFLFTHSIIMTWHDLTMYRELTLYSAIVLNNSFVKLK